MTLYDLIFLLSYQSVKKNTIKLRRIGVIKSDQQLIHKIVIIPYVKINKKFQFTGLARDFRFVKI